MHNFLIERCGFSSNIGLNISEMIVNGKSKEDIVEMLKQRYKFTY